MYNNKTKSIIKALNYSGSVYESDVSTPEKTHDINPCSKKISSATTVEGAFKALYQCMLDYLNSTRTTRTTAALDEGWFRLFVELSHELRSKLTDLLRQALAPLSNRYFTLPPWERFLRVMCALPLWDSISKITTMMDWRLFDYWSGAFVRMINELGTVIGIVLKEVMTDLNLLPKGFDTESLVRFGKKLIETGGNKLVLDLCKTFSTFKLMENIMPGFLGDQEETFQQLWDDVSNYLIGTGGVVLDSMSKTVSAGLAIIQGVGEWMQKNPGTVTLGILIAIAIALTIASGGLAAPEAAAGLVWAARILGITVTLSVEELTKYISDKKIPEGV